MMMTLWYKADTYELYCSYSLMTDMFEKGSINIFSFVFHLNSLGPIALNGTFKINAVSPKMHFCRCRDFAGKRKGKNFFSHDQ